MDIISVFFIIAVIFTFLSIINMVFFHDVPSIKLMFLSVFTMIIGIGFMVIINDESNLSFYLKLAGFLILLFGISIGAYVLKKDIL